MKIGQQNNKKAIRTIMHSTSEVNQLLNPSVSELAFWVMRVGHLHEPTQLRIKLADALLGHVLGGEKLTPVRPGRDARLIESLRRRQRIMSFPDRRQRWSSIETIFPGSGCWAAGRMADAAM